MLREGSFDVDGDVAWDALESSRTLDHPAQWADEALTLEDMLRGWTRSPEQFCIEGERIGEFLKYLEQQGSVKEEAWVELRQMRRIWEMLVGDRV